MHRPHFLYSLINVIISSSCTKSHTPFPYTILSSMSTSTSHLCHSDSSLYFYSFLIPPARATCPANFILLNFTIIILHSEEYKWLSSWLCKFLQSLVHIMNPICYSTFGLVRIHCKVFHSNIVGSHKLHVYSFESEVEMVPKFQAAAPCLAWGPPDSNRTKLNPLFWGPPNYFSKSSLNNTKSRGQIPTMVHKTYYLTWVNKFVNEHPG
jgi:hypothetical protein